MLIDLQSKVVVITGSSRGIGCELVKSFVKNGASVVINYNSSGEKAWILLEEIKHINPNCLMIKADVTDPKEVTRLYKETLTKFGKIDILINNAGICDDNLIQLMPLQQWQRVLDVNLTGCFICSKIFSKAMIRQRSGKIINISSLKGQEGTVGQVNYSASKAGVIALTKTLAKELGKYNIMVNTVSPGFIVTDLNRHDRHKINIAESKSVLPIHHNLSTLIHFLMYMASDYFEGVSGRVFNLDSRIN